MKIIENLKRGDLKDLILPYISIDEYESKISDNKEVIVVAFFVEDKEPAQDLSKFIDRSTETILDTDVSPAPTESGYFILFVEIPRNKEFYGVLYGLLKEIQNVTDIDKWTFKTYKNDEIFDFNKENIKNNVRIEKSTHESFILGNFFDHSILNEIKVYESHIKIKDHYFKIIDIDSQPIFESSWKFEDLSFSRHLDKLLGLNYNTYVNENTIKIYNKILNKTVALEKSE